MPGHRRPVLVLPADRRDGELCHALLMRAGIAAERVEDARAAAAAVSPDTGAVLMTEAALADPGLSALEESLAAQPAWSDLPVVVMAPASAGDGIDTALARFTNAVVIERPALPRTLLSAVQAALRGRARQFVLRERQRAQAAAEQALATSERRRDRFLATLAHELRHPMAPLRMGLALLRSRLGPGADAALHDTLAMMDRELQTLVRHTGELIDVARVIDGRLPLEHRPLDLRETVRGALAAMPAGSTSTAARRRWSCDLPAQPVPVRGDAARLQQALTALLEQAVQATAEDGAIAVRLRTGTADGTGCARIEIVDDGRGLAAAELAGAFDLFVRPEALDEDPLQRPGLGPGLGFGLARARRLVQAHGGDITLHSPGPGQGSVCTLRLPLHEARAAPGDRPATAPGSDATATTPAPVAATATATATLPPDPAGPFPLSPAASPSAPTGRPASILVIDDNEDAADTLCMFLQMLGHPCRAVYSGAEGLASAESERPDIVFCDVGMPGMTGHEFAQKLRRHPGLRDVRLVALTGWGSPSDRQRASEAGFDLHLTKPASHEALMQALQELHA